MGQPIDFFANLNQQLGRLVERKLDPATQLGFQRIDENEFRAAQGEAVRTIIENADFDPDDPSAISDLLGDIAAVDERFLPMFTKAAETEQQLRRQNIALQRFESAVGEQFPTTTEAARAAATGAVPTGIVTEFARQEGRPPDPISPTMRRVFTGESLNAFAASSPRSAERNFALLKFDPNLLESLRSRGEGSPLSTTLSETDREILTNTLTNRIENHPFYKANIEDLKESTPFFPDIFRRFEVKDLAKIDELEPEKKRELASILAGAPKDFRDLVELYTRTFLGVDLHQKLASRGQQPDITRGLVPTPEELLNRNELSENAVTTSEAAAAKKEFSDIIRALSGTGQ